MAIKSCQYHGETFDISYEFANQTAKKSMLILHGWGSNKDIMRQAFEGKLTKYKHIYVDMPGFGKSANSIVLESGDYAQIMKLFLRGIGESPELIMGHSFGGKVATLLNPEYLVLLSSSGILVPKSLKVKAKITLFKILKPFGFSGIKALFVSGDAKGMSHEMYETFKNVVNEEFAHNFVKVNGKALCFWGKNDTATPLWTGEKIANLIKNSKFYPLDGDHFFFLKHSDFIESEITKEY